MKSRVLVILVALSMLLLMSSSIALASSLKTNDSCGNLQASDCLTTYNADISAISANQMQVSFTVCAKTIIDEVGILQIKVERNSGNGWIYARTLSHFDYDNFIKNNAILNKSSVTFTGIESYQYRATITAYAADGSGADSKDAYAGMTTCY